MNSRKNIRQNNTLTELKSVVGVQDFEIAGSGCGGGGGGRSPAGTELTERSWDSHAQYLREPPPRPAPLAPVYCHAKYLLSLEGSFTFIIVVSKGFVITGTK